MPKICQWFHNNGYKASLGKFQVLLIPFVDRPQKIMGSTIKSIKQEVLLGAGVDCDLTFKEHNEYLL